MKFKENPELLAQAKRIFGDIVVKAWSQPRSGVFCDDGTDSLEMQYQDLVIEFSSGRVVKFWCSEWGGFQKLDGTDNAAMNAKVEGKGWTRE